jgi:quinol monooxygenase YgiN
LITFIAHLRVSPAKAAAFEALMTYVAEMTHAHESGVAYYAWAKSADEPGTYVVIEVYRDAQVHSAHMASAWVLDSLPKSAALIEGRPHIRQYVSGDSQPVQRTVASD